jgi:hypothetical protein
VNTTFGPDDWHIHEYSYHRVIVRSSKVTVFVFEPLMLTTFEPPCRSIFVWVAPAELRIVIDLSLIDSVSLYVPGAMTITSPSTAALIAVWMLE